MEEKIKVMREGKEVEKIDWNEGEVEEEDIIRKMVERDMERSYKKRDKKIGNVILEVDKW